MTTLTKLDFAFFSKYQEIFNAALQKDIEQLGEKTKLRDACEYSLTSGGKRIRPVITLMVADALGNQLNVLQAALAIEYMHTASLIVDDLPCMDDDDLRRGKPTLHKVFGETTALLASYSLVNFAYEKIHDAAVVMELCQKEPYCFYANKACKLALGEAAKAGGILGATGGQFLDLFPPEKSLSMIHKVIHQKTVALFEIAFLFGWLFGGGDFHQIETLKNAAAHFGIAFQVADDLQDQKQDGKRGEEMNIALFLGVAQAKAFFDQQLEIFEEKLDKLTSMDKQPFLLLKDLLIAYKDQ